MIVRASLIVMAVVLASRSIREAVVAIEAAATAVSVVGAVAELEWFSRW